MSRTRTTAELNIRRALTAASSRWTTPTMRRRMGLPTTGLITVREGVTVFRASRHRDYGRTTSPRSVAGHLVGAVYTAWSRGVLVGALVKWRCGGESVHFRLTDKAAGLICPFCLAALASSSGGVLTLAPVGGVRR